MSIVRKQSWFVACCVALGVAACGGDKGTGPSKGTFSNPANTKAQLEAVAAPFATPAFESFAGLSLYFVPPAASPAVATLIQATLPRGPTTDAQPYTKSVLRARALAKALLANPIVASIFPSTALGKTYVWDPSSGGYVASSRTGAPSNGIRFIIYTLSNGLPAVPLNAIGYVDFTDRSTASSTILGVTLVATTGTSAVTYADYTVSMSFSTTSFADACRIAASTRGWSLKRWPIRAAARSRASRTVRWEPPARSWPNRGVLMTCPSRSPCRKSLTARAMAASVAARRSAVWARSLSVFA